MKKVISIVDEDTRNKVFEILQKIWKSDFFIIDNETILVRTLRDNDYLMGFAGGIYYQLTH